MSFYKLNTSQHFISVVFDHFFLFALTVDRKMMMIIIINFPIINSHAKTNTLISRKFHFDAIILRVHNHEKKNI